MGLWTPLRGAKMAGRRSWPWLSPAVVTKASFARMTCLLGMAVSRWGMGHGQLYTWIRINMKALIRLLGMEGSGECQRRRRGLQLPRQRPLQLHRHHLHHPRLRL